VQNLGINKTIIAAREIAEIDPYINVKIFNDGLHAGNIDDFFTGDGKLDLFVEVCDGLDVKIESRYKARELRIPVVMDTNDRGMMDVERFDLEPNRPILHGLADGLDPNNIKGLTNEQKIPYILRMIGAETISTRLKASMLEVEQSINTWPQLASSVTLGGALTTDVSRRILLDQYHESGRYYIDLEDLIKDENIAIVKEEPHPANPYKPLEKDTMGNLISKYFQKNNPPGAEIAISNLDKIVDAAVIAPSAGNNQPWRLVFSKNTLFLFHDKYRSWSWGDYYEMGSHMGLGAALENIHIQSHALGLVDHVDLFPLESDPLLIAAIRFDISDVTIEPDAVLLANSIYTRRTNRKVGDRKILSTAFYTRLNEIVKQSSGVNIYYTEDESDLNELAEIIAECDKVRLLHELGHEEFYHEIRWNKEEAEKARDGVELASVDITQSEAAGFKVASDWKAVELLSEWRKGDAFKKLSLKAVKSASSIVLFTMPQFDHKSLVNVGRVVEKVWIQANQEGVSVHPMLSPAFFFNSLIHGQGKDLPAHEATKLAILREKFIKIFPAVKNNHEVFLMKLALADELGSKSLRKDKNDLFYRE
jgi:hypothetical protein